MGLDRCHVRNATQLSSPSNFSLSRGLFCSLGFSRRKKDDGKMGLLGEMGGWVSIFLTCNVVRFVVCVCVCDELRNYNGWYCEWGLRNCVGDYDCCVMGGLETVVKHQLISCVLGILCHILLLS